MRLARGMILVGACGLVIGGVACRSQVPNPSPGPLRVEPAQVDLGTLKQHETAEARVMVTNTTSEPVKIARVKTSCGCLAPDWSDRVIAPSSSEPLVLRFSTGSTWGVKHHEAEVFFHDSSSPVGQRSVKVSIKATVEPDLVVRPRRLDLGHVACDEPITSRIEVERVGLEAPLEITDPRSTHKSLSVRVLTTPAEQTDGDKTVIEVTFDPTRFPGEVLSGEIMIQTNSEAMRSPRISVMAVVDRPFRVEPDSVFLALMPDRTDASHKQLRVTAGQGVDLPDVRLESASPGLRITRSPDGESNAVVFVIEADPARIAGSFESNLTCIVETAGRMEIPVAVLDLRHRTTETEK